MAQARHGGMLSWRPTSLRPGQAAGDAHDGTLIRYLLSGRAGQAAAILLSLAIAALAWRVVVMPARQWYEAGQDRLRTEQRLLGHQQALVAALPALTARIAAKAKPGAPGHRTAMLPGLSDAVAAAALQGELQVLAQQDGVTLDSTETLPAKADGALRRIGLKVRMTTSYRNLITLLAGIAGAKPLMLADDLSIHATELPDTNGSGATDQPMMASFTVSGFRARKRH